MVKFDYSDTLVVSCSDDSTVRLWDVEKAKCTKVLKGHSYTVNAVRWAENQRNNLVVSVGRDYTVRLWDSRSGECSIMSEQFPSEIMYIADQVLFGLIAGI
jgi:WD40 repeat protein